MLNRKLFYIALVVAISFIALGTANAQETKEEKPMMKMSTMDSDSTMMKNCMDKIASDEGMRSMMMQKMMDKSKGDEEGMMKMCQTMMDNPEMHKMMMKMMGGNGGMMKEGGMHDKMMKDGKMHQDKTSTGSDNGSSSVHESHHKNDGTNEKE